MIRGLGEGPCPCLTRIIGPNVRNISVRIFAVDHTRVIDDIIHLADRVSSGGFPSLERVEISARCSVIEDWAPEMNVARRAFPDSEAAFAPTNVEVRLNILRHEVPDQVHVPRLQLESQRHMWTDAMVQAHAEEVQRILFNP